MSEVVVSSMEFSEEGVQIAYMVVPDDIRDDGRLVVSRMIAISARQDEVGDDVVLLREAAERLVRVATTEFDDAEIVEPLADTDGEEDEDESRGMGE